MKKDRLLVIVLLLLTTLTIFVGNSKWQEKVKSATAVQIKKTVTGDEKGLLNMPRVIYNTVGMDLNIYGQNLVEERLDDNLLLTLKGDNADSSSNQASYAFKVEEPGTAYIRAELYEFDEMVAIKKSELITNKMRTTPIKGLIIGDSTIITNGEGYVTKRLIENLGENIELVGTLGVNENRFEGRGGWSAATYRTDTIYLGKKNPFYDPESKDFDFSYYMNNQEFGDLDFVMINLGINDVFNYKSDITLKNDFEVILANYDHIIQSIKKYDSDIKIGLNLSIPPNDSQEVFNTQFGTNYSQAKVKENNFLWVQKLMAYYENSKDVDLVPIFTVIDTKNNFVDSAHPNVDGYNQIADQITSYLNSLD